MQTLAFIAFLLGIVSYTASATLFFADVARQSGASAIGGFGPKAFAVGTFAHATHLVLASFVTHTCPVESLPFALGLSALMTNIAYLLMRERAGITAMGVVVAPLALMFLLGEQFVGHGAPPGQSPSLLLALHVTTNVLGAGLFILAGVASAFYLIQEHRLKNKRRALSGRKLPPLDALDATQHRLLVIGFPLQTFGVVSGSFFLSTMATVGVSEFLSSALAFATWSITGGVLVTRATLGWRGRRAAVGSLLGVACVLLVLALYVFRAGAGA